VLHWIALLPRFVTQPLLASHFVRSKKGGQDGNALFMTESLHQGVLILLPFRTIRRRLHRTPRFDCRCRSIGVCISYDKMVCGVPCIYKKNPRLHPSTVWFCMGKLPCSIDTRCYSNLSTCMEAPTACDQSSNSNSTRSMQVCSDAVVAPLN
jgi:hypothetical protein